MRMSTVMLIPTYLHKVCVSIQVVTEVFENKAISTVSRTSEDVLDFLFDGYVL